MGWWAWFLIALAVLFVVAFVYDRRRGGKAAVHGDSDSRWRDFGRSVEHDNSNVNRQIGGAGPM